MLHFLFCKKKTFSTSVVVVNAAVVGLAPNKVTISRIQSWTEILPQKFFAIFFIKKFLFDRTNDTFMRFFHRKVFFIPTYINEKSRNDFDDLLS
jgi:hypothetical protein